MHSNEDQNTRVINGFVVQATTQQLVDAPGKFEAVLVVRDASGSQTDQLPFINTSDPFQGQADALEAANDFLHRVDVSDEGKLIT
ncbi:hypothetical protein KWH02_19085 [Xanthomonas campestris pv. uppalii]|uniref:hypothetical protein n=1 Tax=Xanthomonas euvesicatoria TaxID=456327 RepID=UPI001C44767F|nr:hypothetical protein [Xanthomonas euvesicatoria]MBV6787251.1 hypothetical protein [Xanthomonas campestris pv. uppalii]